jgi:predicted ATPase
MAVPYRLQSIQIQGYRPFADFRARLGSLEVLVGANGVGKTSLFEFLRFLRDALGGEIPPEIVPGAVGQQVFHLPGRQGFRWALEVGPGSAPWIKYRGELLGPVGKPYVVSEQVDPNRPPPAPGHVAHVWPEHYLTVQNGRGGMAEEASRGNREQDIVLGRADRLALGTVTNPRFNTLYMLREYMTAWRFYSAYGLATEKIRRAVPVQQEPRLAEDAGNLSAVLHFLMTEHQQVFDELQQHLRATVPGFRGLSVKARGGPGEVLAFWRENGVDQELSLADVSDGTLRLLCWMVLALQPNPPTLICIDEPDQGVHPRTLPILAGLFDKACTRTQILLATHASYFLTQFDLEQIGVLRKEDGGAVFVKPSDSKTLTEMLADFGADELERIHRSDELERLA